VKFYTRRFRGNVIDVVAGAITNRAGRPHRGRRGRCAKWISFRLAGRLRRSLAGPAAHSFHHRGRKEDQRGCYGAQAHRFERSACFGPDIGPWRWWWRIETERFRHMVPPENLKIDCVPAEYPDDPADSPQPSHRQIPGRRSSACEVVSERPTRDRGAPNRPGRHAPADEHLRSGRTSHRK
jgi:hypothetical protein